MVADWSVSSSETAARNASEESTSVGRKWRAAKVDFPEPEAPTSATSESSGTISTQSRRRACSASPQPAAENGKPASKAALVVSDFRSMCQKRSGR